MTTYYCDYKNGSDNAAGGTSTPWKTPAKALTVVTNGDTVKFRGSKTDQMTYYRAAWNAKIAGVTWENDSGHTPTWHGGYFVSGDDYGLTGTEPGDPGRSMISVRAHNVTLRGLRVQHVGGSGFSVSTIDGNDNVGSENVLITQCESAYTYGAALILKTPKENYRVQSAEISYCTFIGMGLGKHDPDKETGEAGSDAVQGSVQLLHCEDTHFHHNLVAYGEGEGINVGRGSYRSIVEYNTVHTMDHIHIAMVRTIDSVVRYNVVYHSKNPNYMGGSGTRGKTPGGIRIGDESGTATMRAYPHSEGQQIYGNLIIGGSTCLSVENGNRFDTQMKRAYIGYNTCIGERAIPELDMPATQYVLDIQDRATGDDHIDSLVENNIFYAQAGVKLGRATGAGGVAFRNNSWYSTDGDSAPSSASSGSDITTDPKITNPLVRLVDAFPNPATAATGFSFNNYRLKSDSPIIGRASNRSATNNITPPTIVADLTGATRTDYDRPNSRYFDIGALEYGGVVTNAVTANFSGTPRSGNAPLTVAFSDLSAGAGAAVINSWSWTFGDSGTSTSRNPSHTYAGAGTYTVSLTVQDTTRGLSNTLTQTGYVTVGSTPTASVTAAFSGTPLTGSEGMQVNFTDQSVATGAATISRRAWLFGDGGASTQRNPSRTYTTAGTYTVSLTVYDDVLSLSDGETKTGYITVTDANEITANFTQSSTGGQSPVSVTFTDTSTEDGDAEIDRYVWEFGDGVTIEGVTTIPYIYSEAGTFTPKLTVYDTTRNLVSSKTGTAITITPADTPNTPGVVDVVRQLLPGTAGTRTIPFNLRGHAPALVLLFFTRAVTAGTPVDDATLSIGAVTATEQWASAFCVNDAANPSSGKKYFTSTACIAALADGVLDGLAVRSSLGADRLTIEVTDAFTGGMLTAVAFGGAQWAARAAEVYGGVGGTTTALNPGFEPEWYLFGGSPTRTLATLEDHADFVLGMAGDGAQMGYGWRDVNNVTPTKQRSYYVTPGWLFGYPNGLGAGQLNFTDRTVQFGPADFNQRLGWAALDIAGNTPVAVEEFTSPTSTGVESYSLGWRPSALLINLTNHYVAGPQAAGDMPEAFSIVLADAAATYHIGIASELGVAAGNAKTVVGNDVRLMGPDGATILAGTLAFTDDGFDINWTTVTAVGRRFQVSAFGATPSITGPIPQFEVDDTTPENGEVQFTDLSNPNGSPITAWYWTFGDGGTSSEQHPAYTYNTPGTYSVFLQVTNANGEEHLFKTNYIHYIPARHWLGYPYEPRTITRLTENRLYGDDPTHPYYGFVETALLLDGLELDAQPDADIEPSGRPGKALVKLDWATKKIVIVWPDGSTSDFSED